MPTTRPKSDLPFVSLRAKMLIGFTLVFTIVFAGAYYWFYYFSTERALARIETDLRDTLEGAAAGMDADGIERLLAEGEPNVDGFSDHPDYLAQLAWFQTVQSLEPRAWPYAYVAGPEENQIVALADLWALYDASKSYAFREIDTSSGPLIEGLSTSAFNVPRDRRCDAARAEREGTFLGAVLGPLSYGGCMLARRVGYTDSYGSWVSAYMPIRDESGASVGGLGIDFEMAHVDEVQDAILASTVQAFAITYLTLLLLVLVVSGVVTRPIVRLTAVAARVGEGHYDQDWSELRRGRLRDEIGILGAVFRDMTEKVRQREQSLKRELKELRIEVDEKKRAEEVQEIVDTDFFRELQEKAHTLRSRSGRVPRTGSGD